MNSELVNLIYDAHCHFHLKDDDKPSEALRSLAREISGFALMSTQQRDWEIVRNLSCKLNSITENRNAFMIGIHPWFAHHYKKGGAWLDDLETLLLNHESAGVGEIGLDKKWRTPDTQKNEYEAQLHVFQSQLELAAKYQRCASIHCVKAQGDLFEALRQIKPLPPKIYLHAFGGAPGTVEQLIRDRYFGDRLYFGFASCINLKSPKTKAAIAKVPKNRLLLESDRSSPLPSGKIMEELLTMLHVYTEVKSWKNIKAAALQLKKNTFEFYSLYPSKV